MTKREEIEADIARLKRQRDDLDALIAAECVALDALPKERVRLRWEMESGYVYIYSDVNCIGRVSVSGAKFCGINDDAFLAHICRFGEPDVTREHEALEAAVREYRAYNDSNDCTRYLHIHALAIHDALAALDAARKGGE